MVYDAFASFENEEGFDFFKLRAAGLTTKVLVSPEKQTKFEEFLSTNGVLFAVAIEDYGIALEEERASITKGKGEKAGFSNGRADFTLFWRHHEMEAFVDNLVATFPQFIQKEVLMISPEGRNVYVVKLTNGVFGQKPTIAIESGMHSREW